MLRRHKYVDTLNLNVQTARLFIISSPKSYKRLWQATENYHFAAKWTDVCKVGVSLNHHCTTPDTNKNWCYLSNTLLLTVAKVLNHFSFWSSCDIVRYHEECLSATLRLLFIIKWVYTYMHIPSGRKKLRNRDRSNSKWKWLFWLKEQLALK